MTAVPLTDQQLADIRAQIKQALRTAVSLPTCPPLTEHGDHDYEVGCALCHGDVAILTNAVVAVVQPELDRLRAEIGRMHERASRRRRVQLAAQESERILQQQIDEQAGELDRLRAEVKTLRAGAIEREALLTEARDVLEAAGQNGAHGDDWPAVAPAIRALTAELEQAQADVERIRTRENGVRADRRKALRELEQARQQTEAAHCRLHFIAERVSRLDISEDPTGVAGDVGPYLDGPLHPLDLADYRAAMNSSTPVEICEIPHATVEEEDACEQQRLAQATQPSA